MRESEVVKALMNADRIDGMGANLPVRSSRQRWRLPSYANLRCTTPLEDQSGTIFQGIKWTTEWLDMMCTNTGRKITQPRVEFMEIYGKKYLKDAQFVDRCAQRLGF